MLYFENDYSEGAHEVILQKLIDTNMEKLPGSAPHAGVPGPESSF